MKKKLNNIFPNIIDIVHINNAIFLIRSCNNYGIKNQYKDLLYNLIKI